MKLPMISSLVLATAMLMSAPVLAQTMIGDKTISAEDLPKVQAQCDKLSRLDSGGSLAADDKEMSTDQPGGEGASETSAEEPADAPSTAADTLVTSIDLETLTLDQCKTAGLVK